jgi:flagellum-specific peptidoglycan hydrolase FlgJ
MANNRSLNHFFVLSVIFLNVGCGGAKKVSLRYAKAPEKTLEKFEVKQSKLDLRIHKSKEKLSVDERVNNYVAAFSIVAIEEMKMYDIPASISLAQGILESGMGYSRLAVAANNHFGIKCHSEWEGKRIYHDDDEKGECFRVYKDPRTSYRDHSLFLTSRSRYNLLFDLKIDDYKGWAKGLKKAGYATDPKYSNKLINLIERYSLDRFDIKKKMKRRNNHLEVIKQPSKKKVHIVKKGDTLYSISKKYKVDIKSLVQENQLENNTIFLGQNLIIPIYR